jgi:hypothetical protein
MFCSHLDLNQPTKNPITFILNDFWLTLFTSRTIGVVREPLPLV